MTENVYFCPRVKSAAIWWKEGEKREGGSEGREVVEEWIDAGNGGGGVWHGEDGEWTSRKGESAADLAL